MSLLDIRRVRVTFGQGAERVDAVRGVSLVVQPGESIGIVGESGSGKTSLGLAVTRLLPEPPAVVSAETILWRGETNVLTLSERALEAIRGREIAYIFQEPATCLNPVMTIGHQLVEVLEQHTELRRAAASRRAVELMQRVGIASAEARMSSYPHELSGGMKQRVMIAMAIACSPKLLIADEPTTALDVTLERQIVALLRELQRELGLAIVLISHNIHLMGELASRMVVMWQGQIVEAGPTEQLLKRPQHAYTQRLLAAQPRIPALASS